MPAMMPRGLTAAFLLSMIVVASADRALLNKPSGGALHGVAFFGANYYATNGNGSWVPLAASPDAAPNSGFLTADSCNSGVSGTSGTSLDQLKYGLINVVFPSKSLGVAVGSTCFGSSDPTGTPNIIITLDQAQTWMAVTGLPTTTYAAEVPAFVGTTNPVTLPYPVVNTPDLVDVFFVSKSMGWAVGGSIGSAQNGDATGSVAAILMTSNGGTVWSNVLPALPAAGKLNVGGVPGCLLSVMSDSAGKNVYAVGAPAAVYTFAGPTAAPTGVTPALNTFGTIMYSSNSGASWTMQTAPAIAAYTSYSLNSVFVQKGSTAWAVGGNVANPNSNGIILGTTNGGFSWTLLTFPSSGSGSAPAFTSIAYNGRAAWVGGYVDTADIYPTAATSTASAASYNVLVSTDGKNFSPALTQASFPAGFVKSALAPAGPGNAHVYGIVWDNNLRGFIYGAGFILSTKNSGTVWVNETPNTIIVNDYKVWMLANVPTSY